MALIVRGGCGEAEPATVSLCPRCGLDLEDLPRKQVGNAEPPDWCLAEKRRHQRIELKTMVQVDGQVAMLFNISRSGLMLSSPFQPPVGHVGIALEAGGDSFVLKGTVRWVSEQRSFSNLVDFGVEIVDPPREFGEFVERLAVVR